MLPTSWRKLLASLFYPRVRTIRYEKASRRGRRPRLEQLEDRLAPAVLNINSGVLTYTAGNGVKNDLSVSLLMVGGVDSYQFTDVESISVTGNQAGDFTVSNGGKTVTGPKADVNSISINLGDMADKLTLGTFDSGIAPLSVDGGGDAGNSATIATGGMGISLTGNLSFASFDSIAINNQVQTTGTQTYSGAATLGAATTSLSASSVQFSSTVNGGGNSLSITGNAEFDGNVSAVNALTVSGTTALNAASIATTGDQNYQNAVTLGNGTNQDTALSSTGGTVKFSTANSTVNARAADGDGAHGLSITGSAAFSAAVGGQTSGKLKSLQVSGGSTLTLASVSTTGSQDYAATAITLNGTYLTNNSAFTVENNAALGGTTSVNTSGGAITFKAKLDGTTAFGQDLSLTAGAGNIHFADLVGGSKALGNVTLNAANQVTADKDFKAESLNEATTSTGAVSFQGIDTSGGPSMSGGNVTLAAGGTLTVAGAITATGGGAVNLQGTSVSATSIDTRGNDAAMNSNAAGGSAGAVTLAATSAAGSVSVTGTIKASGGAGDGSGAQGAGGALTFTSDSLTLGAAGSITGNGAVALRPFAADDGIGIAGATGALQLTSTTLAAFADGFQQITIGRDDGTGAIISNAISFSDPVVIEAPLKKTPTTGGTITVNGQITGTGNASITLKGSGGTTTLNASIVTAGTPININDSVILGTPATITLDTTNSGAVAAGAAITITGTVDDDATASGLTLRAGTAGDIGLQKAVGSTTAPVALSIVSAHNATFSGTLHTTGDVSQTTGTGTTFLNGTSGAGIGGKLALTTNAVELDTAALQVTGTVNIQASAGFTQTAGGDLQTADGTANAVAITTTTGNAALQNIKTGTGGTIHVTASAGSVTQAAGTLTGNTVTLNAATGIGSLATNIQTAASFINLTAGATGAFVTNANDGSYTASATGDIQLISTTGTLTIGGASSSSAGNITLCSKNGATAINADLSATAGTARLSSSAGISQGVAGEIDAIDLGIQASGNVTLDQNANKITGHLAAADNANAAVVRFLNTGSFATGTVLGVAGTCFTMTTTGVSSSNGDITLCTNGFALTIGAAIDAKSGTVRLSSAGTIDQSASISAANLAARSAGDITLDKAANSVSGSFAANDTANLSLVRFLDAGGFNVGSITGVAGTCFTADTNGVSSTNGDITLCNQANTLALNAAIDAGTGLVRLSSAAGISQTAGGTITAKDLGIQAAGDVTLDQAASNLSGVFAANNTGGNNVVRFLNSPTLTLGTVNGVAGTCFTTTTTGVTTANGDITLASKNAAIALNEAVDAGTTGKVRLSSGDGITQMKAIKAGALGIQAKGDVVLDQLANQIGTTFAARDSTSGAVIRFQNATGFSIDSVSGVPGTAFATDTTGVSSTDGDVTLCTVAGSLQLKQGVQAGSVTVRLSSAAAITQTASGGISSKDLGIQAMGDITLDVGANQLTGNLAARDGAGGSVIRFANTGALSTGKVLGVAGTCFTTDTTGVTSTNGDISLCNSTGSMALNAEVNAGNNIVRLSSGGGITQQAAITGSGLGVRAAGDVALDQVTNQISSKFAANDSKTGSVVRFLNQGSFSTDAIAGVAGTCFATDTTGVVTTNGDITLCSKGSALTLNQAINAGAATVRLDSSGSLTQTTSGGITAANLGARAVGDVLIDQATNSIGGNLAVNNTGANNVIRFLDAGGFATGTVAGVAGTCFASDAIGVTTSNGDITLNNNAGNQQFNAVVNAGAADVRLTSGGGISQNASGAVTGTNLGLQAAGNVTLDQAANSVTGMFAAAGTGSSSFVHFDDTANAGFTVGSVASMNLFGGATGVTTAGSGDIILTDAVAGANLRISDRISSNSSDVRLGFGGSVMQDNLAGASITAANLGITAAGDVLLNGASTNNNVGGMFGVQDTGAGNAVRLINRASGLTVGPVGASGKFAGTTGIITNNGQVALQTARNFTVAFAPINSVIDSGSAPITIDSVATSGATRIDVQGQINSTAASGATITGAQAASVENAFFMRPGSGNSTVINLVGNGVPVTCVDTLTLQQLAAAKVKTIQFTKGMNACSGTFEFNMDPARLIVYKNIGQLKNLTTNIASAQTTNNQFVIKATVAALDNGQAFNFTLNVPIQIPTVNAFVLSPAFASPGAPFSAPRVAVADTRGTGFSDVIVANGPGGPPIVSVIDGQAVAQGIGIGNANVISRFYAFDPRFMGGLFLAAGVLDSSGKASIVVSKDAVQNIRQEFNEPANQVRVFLPANILSQTNLNHLQELVPNRVINAYANNFLGGVRVGVGDVAGQTPIIVTAPGAGAVLPVQVYNASKLLANIASLQQSFFPYGASYQDGIYVAVANLNASNPTNDILVGPQAGDPLLELFQGPNYTKASQFALAFRSGTGTVLSTGNQVTFNANSPVFGVSSVSFGALTGPTRTVFAGTTIGQKVVLQQLTMQTTRPATGKRSMFFRARSPRGVFSSGSH